MRPRGEEKSPQRCGWLHGQRGRAPGRLQGPL